MAPGTAVRLILVPYHLGRADSGPSRGPTRLLAEGAQEAVRSAGHQTEVVTIERGAPFTDEVSGSFQVNRMLAEAVREATKDGAFPLVLAADCGSAVGTIAGMDAADAGLLWLDAHGDFNTPETTVTGYLDGMGLAMAVGRCWTSLTATIPGFHPVPEGRIVLGGARDFDRAEREALDGSSITHVPPGPDFPARLSSAMAAVREQAASAFVLLDADVLDPSEGHANAYPAPGGITAEDLETSLVAVADTLPLRGASITAYDADVDTDGRIADILVTVAGTLARQIL